jgi:hypothetical protein
MLCVQPKSRATMEEIGAHPWVVATFAGPPDCRVPPRLPLAMHTLDLEVPPCWRPGAPARCTAAKPKLYIGRGPTQIVDKVCSFGYAREDLLQRLVGPPADMNPARATYYLLAEMYEREAAGADVTEVVRRPSAHVTDTEGHREVQGGVALPDDARGTGGPMAQHVTPRASPAMRREGSFGSTLSAIEEESDNTSSGSDAKTTPPTPAAPGSGLRRPSRIVEDFTRSARGPSGAHPRSLLVNMASSPEMRRGGDASLADVVRSRLPAGTH